MTCYVANRQRQTDCQILATCWPMLTEERADLVTHHISLDATGCFPGPSRVGCARAAPIYKYLADAFTSETKTHSYLAKPEALSTQTGDFAVSLTIQGDRPDRVALHAEAFLHQSDAVFEVLVAFGVPEFTPIQPDFAVPS